MKLGRKAVKTDSRTLRLSRYMTAAMPPAPPSRDWTKGKKDWGMMKNDELGDCTIAGIAHAVQVWSLNSVDLELTPSDATVVSYYSKWDGYVPGDPSTDSGGVELDVLNLWKKETFDGHALLGFADADPRNLNEVRQAINLFAGVYIGVTLTNAQVDANVWDVIPNDNSGVAGGHAVWVPKYDSDGSFTAITWGELRKMTPAFWESAVDEVHVLLSPLWINSSTGAPSGFNLDQLQEDISLIR